MLTLNEAIAQRRTEIEEEQRQAELRRQEELKAKGELERLVATLFAQHVQRMEWVQTAPEDWVASECHGGESYEIALRGELVRGHVMAACTWGFDGDDDIYPQHNQESQRNPWRASCGGTYTYCKTLADACIYAGAAGNDARAFEDGLQRCIDEQKELMQELAEAQRWTPVIDELPEENGMSIICDNLGISIVKGNMILAVAEWPAGGYMVCRQEEES